MRIGILGGSFDPVHYGHLLLAESAREQLRCDRILLVPAAHSPLKTHGPVASDAARVDMLRLAIADHPQLEVSDVELRRGGTSYTVDTLHSLRQTWSDAELYLIIGTDQLAQLDRWKEPAAISELATWAIVARGGYPAIDWNLLRPWTTEAQLQAAQQSVIRLPAWEQSSTELRQRAASGASLRYRTPRAVEEYLRAQQVYS